MVAAATKLARVVLVSRDSALQHLRRRLGTEGMVKFYLENQGLNFEAYAALEESQERAVHTVIAGLADEQRYVRVGREQLCRFLFAADDIVVVIGQDGLVPNVAKYLDEQLVIGVNPETHEYDGVLCRHDPQQAGDAIYWAALGAVDGQQYVTEKRSMAQAKRDDGQVLLALNEVFVGHRSHQSAKYEIRIGSRQERQSSSGLVVSTGTGATGWARSIALQRGLTQLPAPTDSRLAWFVREPFPSVVTGTQLDHGLLRRGQSVQVRSKMSEGGRIFADGIEEDWLEFDDGQWVEVGLAPRQLRLVTPV